MKSFNPIKGKELKFAVFDIETKNWIYPYAVGFYDGLDFKYFLGKNCVFNFIKSIITHKYRGYTIFAHNGGKFDFNFLVEILKNLDLDFKMIFQGSRCLNIKVYHHKEGKIEKRNHRNKTSFNDSYALLKFSLDDLTKNFNVIHKKINFMNNNKKRDYEFLYELYKNNDKRFFEYLKNDVLGLYEVLMKFNNMIKNQNGNLGLTIASTSLKTYQKGFLKYNIGVCEKDMNEEIKKAYYGGRTEIFIQYLNDGKYNCYDVNSLYPFVMFNNTFPISKPLKLTNPKIKDILELEGITKCKIKSPNIYFPLLPMHYQINKTNKLIFPIGKFNGYWDNAFLRKAIKLGYNIEIEKMYSFKTDFIFKEFVKKFYQIKNNSKRDSPDYIISKLILNSLYGKFAQKQESEIFMKIKDIKELNNYDIIDIVDNDFNLFRVKTESKGNFFIPQISVHVTTLSQLYLYNIIENILNKGNIVSYCDTDSIFTNAKLNTSNDLGKLKLEYSFKRGYFLLPKTYCIIKDNLEKKIVAKGYSNNFQSFLNENIFKKALFKKDFSGFDFCTKEKKFNSMLSSYVRHKNFVSLDYVKKSINSIYDKRIVLKDFNTFPLKLNE